MNEAVFQTEALDPPRGRWQLQLSGRVYADVAPRLREALDQARADGLRDLVVDARELVQIDSSGLGVFVDLLKRLRPSGGRIVFYGLNDNVRRVFEITKLERVMGVAADREAALGSLG